VVQTAGPTTDRSVAGRDGVRPTSGWPLSVRREPKLARASRGTQQWVHLGEITNAHSDATVNDPSPHRKVRGGSAKVPAQTGTAGA
jgi:hypothetical protein